MATLKQEKQFKDQWANNIHWKNLRRAVFKDAASVEQYGFFGLPVPMLLEMNEWKPHQQLLAEGALKRCESEDEVIFVSQ